MSYCRFSSDGWKSDVYVYESAHGFECHIAGRKHVHPEGKECPLLDLNQHNITLTYAAQEKWLEECGEPVPLNLPEVEDFTTATAKEMAERLIELRGLGYYVPQYAIDALLEEEE